ncbi:MAG: pyridoxal-phosphate dependent enzyme [Planctomycetes bacterium]|nr:pyridoxal-phosphate dependent enzyme [Planctomycetota bacterium]
MADRVLDPSTLRRAAAHLGRRGVRLPTFGELADPTRIPSRVREALRDVDPQTPHPLNLFRIHWFNEPGGRGTVGVPFHLVLPASLTGVEAEVVVLVGATFPMIQAHKVLAAYGCLVPRLVTGRFDPERSSAWWPSTGNYCRGGVAVSRILGCTGRAILPEGMSRERFDWLERWVADPERDILRTPGTESNVREIYEACDRIAREDRSAVILNQFSEYGNALVHYACTGRAVEVVHEHLESRGGPRRARAFVSATGSAGTIAAGDYLKERFPGGANPRFAIVALEALECPTLLANGYGEHNIQGIGDKHVPLIHNVMNTDAVVALSDRATDALLVLFGTEAGRRYLARRRGVPDETLASLHWLGISGIANVLGAIQACRYWGLGRGDVVYTVATDSAAMYASEVERGLRERHPEGFGEVEAAETWGRHLAGAGPARLRELTHADRQRVFQLGYYTWVEQRGVSQAHFDQRREAGFWAEMRERHLGAFDRLVAGFNAEAASAQPAR